MELIDLSFHPLMSEAVLSGMKSCTTRYKRKGAIGDCFWIGEHLFRIIEVSECVISEVAGRFFRMEGFCSEKEFTTFWTGLYDDQWNPDETVFTHFFAYAGHHCRWAGDVREYRPLSLSRRDDE